jgi:hypothetical protein
MRTLAKIEEEIAALATEVHELARQRGRLLPTIEDWVDLLLTLGVPCEELHSAALRGGSYEDIFTGLVKRREVVPVAEPLKEALLAVIAVALSDDRQAYYRALRELRAPLSDLLTQRAEQWVQQWQHNSKYFDLYRAAKNWVTNTAGPPALSERYAEGQHESVVKAKGWALALLAGTALRCAVAELVEVQSLTNKPVESLP